MEYFGANGYGTVSWNCRIVESKMAKEMKFKDRIEKIALLLINSRLLKRLRWVGDRTGRPLSELSHACKGQKVDHSKISSHLTVPLWKGGPPMRIV